jgi:hypothetical protein
MHPNQLFLDPKTIVAKTANKQIRNKLDFYGLFMDLERNQSKLL